jgi:hypothetical protein
MAQRLKTLGVLTAAALKSIIAPMIGKDDLADAIGYVTNAGTPAGSLVPDFVGQLCLDTTNNTFYRAKGVTNADWLADVAASAASRLPRTPSRPSRPAGRRAPRRSSRASTGSRPSSRPATR